MSTREKPALDWRYLQVSLRRWAIRMAVRLMTTLPYGPRLALAGWIGRNLLGRVGPLPRRLAAGIAHFLPELPESERQSLAREIATNTARLTVENFSGADFAARARLSPLEGPGLAALEAAKSEGRPVILVTAHFGNWDAGRAALLAQGFRIAGIYKPFPDPWLNARYIAAIGAVGEPLFSTSREGMAGMIRHLKSGGGIGILADLDRPGAVPVPFLGQPTRTVLSPAEMALKYRAVLVPIYGIRQSDGRSFRVWLDAPIPHGDPLAMTRAVNDSLSAMIRRHPAQWIWWHNRRKAGHPGLND